MKPTPKTYSFIALALLLTLHGAPESAQAQAPHLINYQGRLINGTNLVNGPVNLRFRIFSAETGGLLVYESTNIATAVDGLYTSTIGQHSTLGTLLPGLGLDGGDGGPRWLEVAVNGTTLTPRERLKAVPFSVATYGLWPRSNNAFTLGTFGQGLAIPSQAENAVILGGQQNLVGSTNAAIVAGRNNYVDTDGAESIIAGGRGNRIDFHAPQNAIVGGSSNMIGSYARGSIITGGEHNQIGSSRQYATIGGGSHNEVDANYATVAGGRSNRAASIYATVAGGWENRAGFASAVGGGSANLATGSYSTVAGGFNNRAGGSDSVVAGGLNNVALGTGSMVPGGNGNQANGPFSFAAGRNAFAQHEGAFIWNGSSSTFSSTATNQFLVRASGGVGINTNNPQAALHVAGEAMIGNNPQPAKFGMQRINTGSAGILFTHPGMQVTMSWVASNRTLMVSNASPFFVQTSISLMRTTSPDVAFVVADVIAGGVASLASAASAEAASWTVHAGGDARPGGFTFQGVGFGTFINGLVTYWE